MFTWKLSPFQRNEKIKQSVLKIAILMSREFSDFLVGIKQSKEVCSLSYNDHHEIC